MSTQAISPFSPVKPYNPNAGRKAAMRQRSRNLQERNERISTARTETGRQLAIPARVAKAG